MKLSPVLMFASPIVLSAYASLAGTESGFMPNESDPTVVETLSAAQIEVPELDPALTLERITSEPDWIARSPTNPRWLIDGSAILYSQRREGVVGRDFSDQYLIFMSSPDAEPSKITPENPGPFFTDQGVWNTNRTLRILSRQGDLFLYDAQSNSTTQLTQTSGRESSAFFLADKRTVFTRFAFYRSGSWFIRNLDSGYEFEAADIRFEDAPESEVEELTLNSLEEQQRDLFEFVRIDDQKREIREQEDIDWRNTDPSAVPGPFYMGNDREAYTTSLSPSAKHMVVLTRPKNRANDKRDWMPDYVTDDGYVSTRSVRPKVGTQSETAINIALLDLSDERVIDISLDDLPTIQDDPLAWLKEKNQEASDEHHVEETGEETGEVLGEGSEPETQSDESKTTRPVSSFGVRWSESGRFAAIMLMSHDNKDRWIMTIDTQMQDEDGHPDIRCAHHLRDEAWINWNFNSFGFIPTSETLWFLSEESNYSHFYTLNLNQASQSPDVMEPTQLTDGAFEVRDPVLTKDGSAVYVRTNRVHPGMQELEKLDLQTGSLKPVTEMKGTVESYSISPNESQVVIRYSNINQPPELFLVELETNPLLREEPIQLTHTVTNEFLEAPYQTPEIVAVPSSHTDQPIYTRVYLPDETRFEGPRPIVVFSHGAGYLQHANYEWSYYYREHLFHSLLAEEGFIVVSPDFRASEGYGRDWRTAIYRKMGYPELEDFQDCIDFAAEQYNGDPDRVGIYGGSYGGFMTLMAMFLEPDTYTCGAALRSVTDWRHYNHGYTSNILNTPDIDPEAYDLSSPINHAEGLQGHLLMLHGLLDDNVVAQDVIRLSQRLIELEKENWELALHPIEPHGYKEPSSWLDQMRRIHKLFREQLSSK